MRPSLARVTEVRPRVLGRGHEGRRGYDVVDDARLAWHVCELFVTLGRYLEAYRKQVHWQANYGPDALRAYEHRWIEAEGDANWTLLNEVEGECTCVPVIGFGDRVTGLARRLACPKHGETLTGH